LSHFDRKIGPKIIKAVGDEILKDNLIQIARYMDYHEKGFFIHEFKEIRSANYIFFLESPIGRGNAEIAMISVVLIHDKTNPRSYYFLLKKFVNKCKQIKDAYKGFYLTKGGCSLAQECYRDIKALMHKIYNKFPLESIIL